MSKGLHARLGFLITALLLVQAACSLSDLGIPGFGDSGGGDTPSAAAPANQGIPGWREYRGKGVALWLPERFYGGDPQSDMSLIQSSILGLGAEYEDVAQNVKDTTGGMLLWVYDPENSIPGILTNVSITAENVPGMDLTGYLDESVKAPPVGMIILDRQEGSINGIATGRLLVEIRTPSYSANAVLYVVRAGETFYSLTYFSPQGTFESLLPMFERSVRTFRAGNYSSNIAELPAPEQPVSSPGSLLDDFSDPSSGWGEYNDDTAQRGYVDGQYQFFIFNENILHWAVWPQNFYNITISADVNIPGPLESDEIVEVGLVCGYQNQNNFYFAAVTSNGYFAFFQITGAGEALVGVDDWQETPLIFTGADHNHIALDCVQNIMRLTINGGVVAEVATPSNLEGQVGMIVGSFTWPGTQALFDNYGVQPFNP